MGIVAALALEALLLVLLLTLGRSEPGGDAAPLTTITSFDASSSEASEEPEQEPDRSETQASDAETSPTEPEQEPVEQEDRETDRAPVAPALIPVSPSDMAAADISPSSPPAEESRPVQGPSMGPPAPGAPSDTPRVGTAPNGEPLYAARWYREPRDGELAGYLSTASGPGWALIACRTAEKYRVEDCVPLEESPRGSNIARSVLAAAWQFQVRPPSLGGEPQVGSWVRIRIDYGIRRQ